MSKTILATAVLILCFADPAHAIEDSAEHIADGEMFLLEIGGNRMITGDPIIYPGEPQHLEDLTLTIRSEKGILSWLPGKSVVQVTDRHVSDDKSPQDGRYTITEKVEVKVVFLGIPFKKIRRRSKETIDAERGLVRHVLEASDGSRSVIRLLPEDGAATAAQDLDAS